MKKTIKKISFLLFGLMIVSCSDSTEEYLEGNMLEKQFQGTKMGNHVTYKILLPYVKDKRALQDLAQILPLI